MTTEKTETWIPLEKPALEILAKLNEKKLSDPKKNVDCVTRVTSGLYKKATAEIAAETRHNFDERHNSHNPMRESE